MSIATEINRIQEACNNIKYLYRFNLPLNSRINVVSDVLNETFYNFDSGNTNFCLFHFSVPSEAPTWQEDMQWRVPFDACEIIVYVESVQKWCYCYIPRSKMLSEELISTYAQNAYYWDNNNNSWNIITNTDITFYDITNSANSCRALYLYQAKKDGFVNYIESDGESIEEIFNNHEKICLYRSDNYKFSFLGTKGRLNNAIDLDGLYLEMGYDLV